MSGYSPDVSSISTNIATLQTDVTALAVLTTRLSATRAGYLDDIPTVLTRLSVARAGYLDNLSAGAVALNADAATLLTRVSAVRAGYLDNLSAGAVALNATVQHQSATSETTAGTISPAPNATANTYGAWVQIIASLAANMNSLQLNFSHTAVGTNELVRYQIGIGGAGSESIRVLVEIEGTTPTNSTLIAEGIKGPDIPLTVPSGTRVAIRMQTNLANGGGMDCWGTLYEI